MTNRVIYSLDTETVLDVLNGLVAFNLPAGAKIVDIREDHLRYRVELLCVGEVFDPVPAGAVPPIRTDLPIRHIRKGVT